MQKLKLLTLSCALYFLHCCASETQNTALTTQLLEPINLDIEGQQPLLDTRTVNHNRLKTIQVLNYAFAIISSMNGIGQLLTSLHESVSPDPNVSNPFNISYFTLIMPLGLAGAGAWVFKKGKKNEQDIAKLLLSTAWGGATNMLALALPGSSRILHITGGAIATVTPAYVWIKNIKNYMRPREGLPVIQP